MRTSLYATNVLLSLTLWMTACSEDDAGMDPCASTSISLSANITGAHEGENDGSIAASASGSQGFTFSLAGGDFQSSGTFSGLAAGTYTITAKDQNDCTAQQTFTVPELSTPNVSYNAEIRPIIENVCWNCHKQAGQAGFPHADLSTPEKVQENATRINTEVQAGRMPKVGSLTSAEKSAIAAWVEAGAPIDN
ncbi:MAG: hypothetical protein FWJ85_00690 [Solitalea sp.]